MAESKVRLPSGIEVVIKHKDGASEQDVLNFAFNEYVTNQDPGTKIGSSIAQGIDTLQQSYGSSIEGLGNLLDAESLKQIGGDIVLKNQAEIDARLFRESQAPTDKTQVTKALDYVAELAGQSAPQMATSVGGAAIGGAIGLLGGPLAPFTVPAGAFLGGFISNVPYFYGSNRERQKESIERGYKLEVDEGAAMLAAIPQASLDSIIAAVGAKFIATPAMKIGGGVFTKVAAGSTIGSLTEIPTEIGQTVLERQQAGLPLSDDEAIKEYIDAGVGGAVLGGLFGGAGGAVSSVSSSPSGKKKDAKTQKSDLGKPVAERSAIEVPRSIEVTYQPVDGNPTTIILHPEKGEDAFTAAERILEGRRLPDSDMTVNEVIEQTPLEVSFDEQEADILKEDVLVDPVPVEPVPVEPVPVEPVPVQPVPVEPTPTPAPDPEPAPEQAPEGEGTATPQERLDYGFAVDDLANELYTKATGKKYTFRGGDRDLYLEAEAKAEEILKNKKVLEPSVETAPESEPTSAPDPTAGKTVSELAQDVGITEQNFRETYPDLSRRADERARSTEAEVDPRTGLPGFSLPQNLKKGKPGYRQTQGITFASDLERAAYSATTSTRSEPGKRKRDSYRKLLQDTGYSSTEINTMGREVRSQMRSQYKGPGSELSVSLAQDVVAEDGTILTEQDIKDGKEGEHGVVVDTPVTGDVVADAAAFKPSRPVIVPDAPVIKRSSLRGKSGFIYFSDRTRVGTYTGLNPDSQISIPLQGGMGYAFIPQNVQAEAGWAFTSDNIFTRFRDKVNETDGIGYVALYTKENLRANGTFLLAYIAEVKYALASGKLTQADFRSEINGLRERFLAKKVKDKDFISRDVEWYSLWNKKWKTPEDLQAALDAAGFETRAAAFSAKKATTKNAKPGDLSGGQLASKRSVKKGMPDVIGMIDLFVEPDLADRKRGEIIGAVQFQQGQESAVVAGDIGSDEHFSYPLVIRGRGIGVFDSTVNVLDVIKTQKEKNQALRSAETSFPTSSEVGSTDVTAQAAETAIEDRGPQDTFENGGQVMDFIEKSFNPIAEKLGLAIRPAMRTDYVAQYNVTQKIIEYNPMALLNRSKAGIQAAMREEIIHAAMHNVLIQKEKKARTGRSEDALWIDFFTALGNNLTPQERTEIQNVYQSLQEGDMVGFGSEYSRAVVQKFRYGDFSEQYVMPDKGGPAFQAIVDLLRSVQAYMAKVLGPMVKTDPEAAQVIVDTVELLNAIDPAIRPKSQNVVANAYNAVDKNTAEENAEGDVAPKDASQRVREERKWWDGKIRSSLSKSLTPIITRLRRINPQFGLLFQRLENTIRERSLKYKKQAQPFFNKLNSLKGDEFAEIKQLLFFSPTPAEANLPENKATMQRRDALLHKHGLLNMYRLDVQPILEEIYAQYSELGMPIGYLEDYFPRVVKDLEGLIKSYGYETKRTFGNLVRDENARRKEDGLPEMESSERARFFQDFLQNKSSFGPKGVRPPGNVKVREIQTIEPSKLHFYEDLSISFGSYTTSMVSAIEAYKVLGATNQAGNKGETGELGKLTERLFQEGKIDEQDASELKSLSELATIQAGQELEILKFAGQGTYAATLIDVATVLVQFLDLAKVLVLRGPSATAQGLYRTVTGNRVFDIERDFSIMKEQIMAEYDDAGATQRILNLGLRYIVPFQQMDVAMKHTSVEATFVDYLKKANSPVGSKKYQQLMTELAIRMGPDAAFKAVQGLQKKTFDKNSPEVKEALMMELFDRQPLTYLQIPETHRRNPNSRLLYKLKTFMILDINFNRQLALNDLMGPSKTIKQRYKGLKMLVAMMAALTAIGVPKDLLLDFIRGKDTYLSDHVVNNILNIFGLSRYGVGTIFKDGPVDAIVDRFKPAAYSIVDGTENDVLAWVNGDREISEFKVWKNAPVFDIWGRYTDDFQEKKEKLYKEKRKEGQVPFIRR